MAVITISRGSYSHGREVAEKVCARLGYHCVSREIILKASEHFNTPEIELTRAVHDAPSILERFTYGKERYVAYFREALLHHLIEDNVIYHGLSGQFFVKGVSHALRVRIIADIKDRLALEMQHGGGGSEADNLKLLIKDDEQRRRWSHYLYGIDTRDPSLYDLVIHVGRVSTDDAVEIVADAVSKSCFQTTAESQKAMELLFKAAQVQAALVKDIPSAKVEVENGEIVVSDMGGFMADDKKLTARIEEIVDEKRDLKVKVRLRSR
ncbi:MAG: cytidylate kinase-like family protein [Syntrophobacteraceae bacterium]|nr:cytidylate kinase-like family protein [Syntrophobacteraceae bacterium]